MKRRLMSVVAAGLLGISITGGAQAAAPGSAAPDTRPVVTGTVGVAGVGAPVTEGNCWGRCWA